MRESLLVEYEWIREEPVRFIKQNKKKFLMELDFILIGRKFECENEENLKTKC